MLHTVVLMAEITDDSVMHKQMVIHHLQVVCYIWTVHESSM